MPVFVRYQLRELLVPFSAWVVFLYLLLMVMQFLRGSELLLGSAITATDFAEILVYLAPHFMMLAVPIALLLAILLGYGRFNEDRELVAMNAVGMGPGQLLLTPMLLGLALSGLLLLLTFTGEPWGLSQLKSRANDVIKRNMVGDVRAGVFYEDLTQLTLYVEEVDRGGGRWRNGLIHDDRDLSAPLLVLAREGRVQPSEALAALRFSLADGQVHRSSVTGRSCRARRMPSPTER